MIPPPPQVLATQPVARSSGVVYDTPISVDFSTEMDASTLTTGNVFLKLDTQRVPILLAWNATTRRLTIQPQARLQLRRTYTVELTSGIRTADGQGFGDAGWYFQFTTNSARRPDNARPRTGDSNESPFVMLSWDSTETVAGNISYEVWGGLDSVMVAVRAGTPLVTSPRARWLPETRWPLGQRIYWAITVVNATTAERFLGPVRSFSTLPNGVALDSLLVRGQDSGINYLIFGVSPVYPYQFCSSDSVWSQSGTQSWMTFPLSGLPADVRVASARLEVYTFNHYVSRLPTTTLTLWSSKLDWPRPCRTNIQFRESLPIQDQAVATGHQESDRRILFVSDLLAAHVEASVRRGGFFGYEFVTSQRIAYATARILDATYHPYLKIHYYRPGPGPALAKAP
ncbi:MAG: Ig-like domain-containing protein [Candidatus Eisenbacteria bacterium]